MIIKVFNGREYAHYDTVKTKLEGQAVCKRLRKKGQLARLIKTHRGYDIYSVYWKK